MPALSHLERVTVGHVYTTSTYGAPTALFLSDGTSAGFCERGILTGDVRGPFYFSLALHRQLRLLQDSFPSVDLATCLDDITLHGSVEDVLGAVSQIKGLLKNIGCTLHPDNKGKNQLFCLNPSLQFHSNITRTDQGFEVVGCPIGTKDHIEACMAKKIHQLYGDMSSLKYLRMT